jgi:hypothetical protein
VECARNKQTWERAAGNLALMRLFFHSHKSEFDPWQCLDVLS